jgi:hypothetical protein
LDQQNALSENNVSYFEQPIKLGGQAFVSRMLGLQHICFAAQPEKMMLSHRQTPAPPLKRSKDS